MITTILFDLGGVLIAWDPIIPYLKAFDGDREKAQWFIDNICTMDWNEEQDGGRSIAEANRIAIASHPEHEELIKLYYGEWESMLTGAIEGTVDIFRELKESGKYQICSITNWSAETFPIALARYDFLQWFDDISVSGELKMRKPFPEIYQHTLDKNNIVAKEALFIDDNLRNIEAAQALGIQTVHFQSASQLRAELLKLGVELSGFAPL